MEKEDKFVTQVELEKKLSERETNRWRATAKLLDDIRLYYQEGKNIPFESIKGLIYALLFPRIIIIFGSLIGIIFIGYQTYIFNKQTSIFEQQTTALNLQNSLLGIEISNNLEQIFSVQPTDEILVIKGPADYEIELYEPVKNTEIQFLKNAIQNESNSTIFKDATELLFSLENFYLKQLSFLTLLELGEINSEFYSKIDESERYLEGVQFYGTTFSNSSIENFSFAYTYFDRVFIRNMIFDNLEISLGKYTGPLYEHPYGELSEVGFERSNINNSTFIDPIFQQINFYHTTIDSSKFYGGKFENVIFGISFFLNSAFDSTRFVRSKFSLPTFENVEFNESDFYETEFITPFSTKNLRFNDSYFFKSTLSLTGEDISILNSEVLGGKIIITDSTSINSFENTRFRNIDEAPEWFFDFARRKGATVIN